MAFAAMPEEVGVEGIFGVCELAEVEALSVELFGVVRVAFADCAFRGHRADFVVQELPGLRLQTRNLTPWPPSLRRKGEFKKLDVTYLPHPLFPHLREKGGTESS